MEATQIFELEVQKYLREKGLDALVDEFAIKVGTNDEYPDLVVLNYDQINSPKFNPICDECRGLILEVKNWNVVSQAFTRFYNGGECPADADFPIHRAKIQEKLDGSIISVYSYGDGLQIATRGVCDASGETVLGNSFNALFRKTAPKSVWNYINGQPGITYVFELCTRENRIVTPYDKNKVVLIGGRGLIYGSEFDSEILDEMAEEMGVDRPKTIDCKNLDEVIAAAEALDPMDEGFVAVVEEGDSFRRIKVKNSSYVVIHHLRGNGLPTPKNMLHLILENEVAEYISYFPEDKKYFDFIQDELAKVTSEVYAIWSEVKDLDTQKDYALAVQDKCTGFVRTLMFEIRKGNDPVKKIMNLGAKKVAKSLNLKEKMKHEFEEYNLDYEDEVE